MENHLDLTKTYSLQRESAKQRVRETVSVWITTILAFTHCNHFQLLKYYPDLERYRDYWPIGDLMQIRLQALAAKQQRRQKPKASTRRKAKVRVLMTLLGRCLARL